MRKLFLIAGAVLFGITVSAQQLRGNIEGGYTFGSGNSGRLELGISWCHRWQYK